LTKYIKSVLWGVAVRPSYIFRGGINEDGDRKSKKIYLNISVD